MTHDTRDSISLADEARTLRERVAARLAELEPLVREYEELQRVAAEIGLASAGPADSDAGESRTAPAAREEDRQRPAREAQRVGGDEKRPPGGQRRSTRSAPRRRQARRGPSRPAAAAERDERVLEAVAAHPGATVAEIASVLGVDAVSLYRPVRDLASGGRIVKRGRGLFPAMR